MRFKANVPNNAPTSLREETRMKYDRCRANLLLVLIFTAVNLFTVTFGDTYYLFSATIPMLIPATMSLLAADTEFLAEVGLTSDAVMPLLIVALVIGLILTLPYLLCWIFSKKRVGWMIGALVFFTIDCLFLMISFDLSMIADILIHAWVMFYLVTGVIHGSKLKNMPEDEPLPELDTDAPAADNPFDTFGQADFTYDATASAEPAETAEDTGEAFVAKSDDEQ